MSDVKRYLKKQWFCEECKKSTFYDQDECRICHAPKNENTVFYTWKCRCSKVNRDDNEECQACGEPGPHVVRRVSRRSPSPERPPKRARSRSRSPHARSARNRCTWECQHCGNWNSHQDLECLRCDGSKFNY